VFVSIAPQAFLVERLGGEHVAVHVLLGPGQSPHTFEPTPRHMAALGRADLYFALGMPFESQLVERIRASRQRLTIVDMARGIKKRKTADHHEHEGDPPGPNSTQAEYREQAKQGEAPELDPHIWLSPVQMKALAGNTADALQQSDPENAGDYGRSLEQFLKELEAVDARIRRALGPFGGEAFYVYHPAFGYFADAYGLKQVPVEVGGKSPTPRQLTELVRKARSEKVKIIFVQPQFDQQIAETVAAAIGGAVVPMDPLAKDVLSNLESMAASIERALTMQPAAE
jgi:zinc transport system substrate-binding protein